MPPAAQVGEEVVSGFVNELDSLVSDCPDCGVEPGELHRLSCDVGRCKKCGYQLLSCDHRGRKYLTLWTGIWPGLLEAAMFEVTLNDLNGPSGFVWNQSREMWLRP